MNQKLLIQLLLTFVVLSVVGIILYITNMNSALAALAAELSASSGGQKATLSSKGVHLYFTVPSVIIGILCLLYCVLILLPCHFAWNRLDIVNNKPLYYAAWTGTGLLAGGLLLFGLEPVIALKSVPYGIRSDFNKLFEFLGYGWVNFMVYFTTVTGSVLFAFQYHKSHSAVFTAEQG